MSEEVVGEEHKQQERGEEHRQECLCYGDCGYGKRAGRNTSTGVWMAAQGIGEDFGWTEGRGLSGMPKIQIKIEHGMIQAVEGLRPEVAVEVLDYDVEKYDGKSLAMDETGKACEIKEWHAAE